MNTNAHTEPLTQPIPEAARRLGVGRSTIYELIKFGELRAIKLRGRTLIPTSEIHRIVNEAAGVKVAA